MKIYIGWSGQTSFKIAQLLRDLIRDVIPGEEPWVSAEDIEGGERWSPDLLRILDQSNFAIICVDPSNFLSNWLNFETGAIVKSISKWRIRVYLNELEPNELKGPFSQFQAVKADRNDTRRMFEDIHANLGPDGITLLDMMGNLDDAWLVFQAKVSKLKVDAGIPIEEVQGENGARDESNMAYIDEVDEKILALISVNDGIEEEKIATTVYLPRGVLQQHLISLEKKELVWSNLLFGVRRWFITDQGKKYLPAFYHE